MKLNEKSLPKFNLCGQYRNPILTRIDIGTGLEGVPHEMFINELRPKKLFVTNTVVIKYVNNLHPSLLMYCLNYNMRKRMVNTIKSTLL